MQLLSVKNMEEIMATYIAKVRTNYFSVSDKEKFISMCNEIDATPIEHGETVGFYFNGDYGLWDEEISCITENLQQILDPGDACVITEVGSENMRYLIGGCTIITRDKVEYVNLQEQADKKVREILKNPDWKTDHSY